jgi:cell division protein FtsQ
MSREAPDERKVTFLGAGGGYESGSTRPSSAGKGRRRAKPRAARVDGGVSRRVNLTQGRQKGLRVKPASLPEEALEEGGKVSAGRKALRMAALSVALLLSVAGLLWVYTGTGVLNVKQVEVRGNQRLSDSYIRELSGITAETHLLKMDVKGVEKALCSDAYVAGVSVARKFPYTVVLDINERRPLGSIYQNGSYHLIDGSGMVLESVAEKPTGIAEISLSNLPLLFPGQEIGSADFESVSELLESLPDALRGMVTGVGRRDGDGLYLIGEGTRVIYGDTTELARKNDIAAMALTDLARRYRSVQYIDVSFPDHPVIKPN